MVTLLLKKSLYIKNVQCTIRKCLVCITNTHHILKVFSPYAKRLLALGKEKEKTQQKSCIEQE